MNAINKSNFGALFILLLIVLMGCEKYPDGGLISKADIRLSENTWRLEQYLRNGNDVTSSLLIDDFIERYEEEGTMIREYIDKNGDPFSESGSWKFDSDKQQINLTGVSSIEFTDETSTVSASDYNILKLKSDELWYYFDNGGDRHELRFIPN